MRKFFMGTLILALVLFVNACSVLEDSYVDRKITDMDKRISKLEADMLTVKFKLGLIDYEELIGKDEEETTTEEVEKTDTEELVKEEEKEEAEVDPDKYKIEITDPDEGETVTATPILFVGKVSSNAKKIVVTAKGEGYTDEYELQNYEAGNENFWYKAAKSFNNLADGENTYEFKVIYDDGESKTFTRIIKH